MIEENERACQWCGKDFRTLCDLRRHVIIHTGEKPFTCFYCDIAYSRKEKLRDHCVKVHELTRDEFKAKAHAAFGLPRGRPPSRPRDFPKKEVAEAPPEATEEASATLAQQAPYVAEIVEDTPTKNSKEQQQQQQQGQQQQQQPRKSPRNPAKK